MIGTLIHLTECELLIQTKYIADEYRAQNHPP